MINIACNYMYTYVTYSNTLCIILHLLMYSTFILTKPTHQCLTAWSRCIRSGADLGFVWLPLWQKNNSYRVCPTPNIVEIWHILINISIPGGILSYVDIVMISIVNEFQVFSIRHTLRRSLFLICTVENRRTKFQKLI
jgi:hypothetical protein